MDKRRSGFRLVLGMSLAAVIALVAGVVLGVIFGILTGFVSFMWIIFGIVGSERESPWGCWFVCVGTGFVTFLLHHKSFAWGFAGAAMVWIGFGLGYFVNVFSADDEPHADMLRGSL